VLEVVVVLVCLFVLLLYCRCDSCYSLTCVCLSSRPLRVVVAAAVVVGVVVVVVVVS